MIGVADGWRSRALARLPVQRPLACKRFLPTSSARLRGPGSNGTLREAIGKVFLRVKGYDLEVRRRGRFAKSRAYSFSICHCTRYDEEASGETFLALYRPEDKVQPGLLCAYAHVYQFSIAVGAVSNFKAARGCPWEFVITALVPCEVRKAKTAARTPDRGLGTERYGKTKDQWMAMATGMGDHIGREGIVSEHP